MLSSWVVLKTSDILYHDNIFPSFHYFILNQHFQFYCLQKEWFCFHKTKKSLHFTWQSKLKQSSTNICFSVTESQQKILKFVLTSLPLITKSKPRGVVQLKLLLAADFFNSFISTKWNRFQVTTEFIQEHINESLWILKYLAILWLSLFHNFTQRLNCM